MTRYRMLIWFIIGVTMGLLIPPTPANSAGHMCKARTDVIKQLSKVFNEAPVFRALSSDGRVLEVLTSLSGTWTIIMTNTYGQACLAAAGEAWETVERKEGKGT